MPCSTEHTSTPITPLPDVTLAVTQIPGMHTSTPWVWGYYGTSASMSGVTPSPPYADWPNVREANPQDRLGFGLDPAAVLGGVRAGGPFGAPLPQEIVDAWLAAYRDTYGAARRRGARRLSTAATSARSSNCPHRRDGPGGLRFPYDASRDRHVGQRNLTVRAATRPQTLGIRAANPFTTPGHLTRWCEPPTRPAPTSGYA